MDSQSWRSCTKSNSAARADGVAQARDVSRQPKRARFGGFSTENSLLGGVSLPHTAVKRRNET